MSNGALSNLAGGPPLQMAAEHPFALRVLFDLPVELEWAGFTDWTWVSVGAAIADQPVIDDSVDDQLVIVWTQEQVEHELNQARKWELSATVMGMSRPILTERYYVKPEGTKGTSTGTTYSGTISIGDLTVAVSVSVVIVSGGATDPADLLAAIKTVDGTGSGLDADTVDGLHAADFETPAGATAKVAAEAVLRAAGDAASVTLTGNQTVAGIKTFSSSPVVPLPTTEFQAATKGYVDSFPGLDPSTAPVMRSTTGAPTVLATDIVGDFAFDSATGILYGPLTGTPIIGQPWINGGTSGAVVSQLTSPAASTIVSGIVELATRAEAAARADTARAVTPDGLDAAFAAHEIAADPHGDRAYTDAQIASFLSTAFDFKASVRAATTANITLSGAQTIDGVSVISTNRVLVKNQSTGSENGLYVAAAGAWARSTDADANAEVTAGLSVPVEEGTVNGGRVFLLTTANPITVGSTALSFSLVDAGDLRASNNLSDLTNAGTARTNIGLGSVDNTADTAKPVSTAQQTALDLKAPLASPTFTGTVAGITKTMVGLGSVDNTADTAKPVSTAQQTALDLKANLASPTFTGTPAGPTAAAATNTTQLATTAMVQAAVAAAVANLAVGDPAPPTGLLASNMPRNIANSGTVVVSSTGRIRLVGVKLYAGMVIGHLDWASGSTAAITPTHSFMLITDSAGVVLATTADNTTLALGAGARFDWAIANVAAGAASSYTVPTTGFYYLGLGISAATMPTHQGFVVNSTVLTALTPMSGADGGLQATLPAVGATLTVATPFAQNPWMAAFT